MLSATSNIELEFFRNFLNMFKSKIPISANFAVLEGAVTVNSRLFHAILVETQNPIFLAYQLP